MELEVIKEIILTRLETARLQGNGTEASLMFELLKMSQELEERRKREGESEVEEK